MESYSKEDFIQHIQAYLNGQLSEDKLHHWSAGFLNLKEPLDPLLNKVWAVIHKLNEINPDWKTTEEEIKFMLDCLMGKKEFSANALDIERMNGLNRLYRTISNN